MCSLPRCTAEALAEHPARGSPPASRERGPTGSGTPSLRKREKRGSGFKRPGLTQSLPLSQKGRVPSLQPGASVWLPSEPSAASTERKPAAPSLGPAGLAAQSCPGRRGARRHG